MRDLAQLLTFREYKAGEEIYKFGDEAENFFIVLNGVVKMTVKNPVID